MMEYFLLRSNRLTILCIHLYNNPFNLQIIHKKLRKILSQNLRLLFLLIEEKKEKARKKILQIKENWKINFHVKNK